MIVFNPVQMGSAKGVRVTAEGTIVEGGDPSANIHFGVDDAVDIAGGAGDAAYRRLKNALRNKYNEYLVPGIDAVTQQFGSSGTQRVLEPIEYSQGTAGAYIDKKLGNTSAIANRNAAQVSLESIISGFGLITGVSLDFQDPVNRVGIQVEAGAMVQLYQASISGVLFSSTCGAEGLSSGRHGLEPLLEYFYHHRVTNSDKDLTKTVMKFGKTVLRGWVVGFSAQPLNRDFRIWQWAIHLLVSPDYRFESVRAASLAIPTTQRVGEGGLPDLGNPTG